MRSRRSLAAALAAVVLMPPLAAARPAFAAADNTDGRRRLLAERRAARAEADELDDAGGPAGAAKLPDNARVLRDVAYGRDAAQRFDVYLPARTRPGAPLLLMVHGGGWRRGDKAMGRMVDNKVAHWVGQRHGVLVSTNYRMLPEADPVEQSQDVARAIAAIQASAASWGADPKRVVLIGHSAGAHLVSLLNSDPARAAALGAAPWLGTVSLDSGAYDVPAQMRGRHFSLYDDAFGADPAFWRAASPSHALTAAAPPLFAVCSSQRRVSCPQARDFEARARSLGLRVEVLALDRSHAEINAELGLPGPYTDAVDRFIASLR